tara:strand:- start:390 stop:1520 length:1131 start_codon:yes stop_codon:yes gene_type:complete
MNLIDRVLLEWSYKTKKGYPDINSQEDMALFESIFGFNLQNEAKKSFESLSSDAQKVGKEVSQQLNIPIENILSHTRNTIIILTDENRGKVLDSLIEMGFERDFNVSGSSTGGVRNEEGVAIIVKPLGKQGDNSAGKKSETGFNTLIKSHVELNEGPITVIFKGSGKTLKYDNVANSVDASKVDATKFFKADSQFVDSKGLLIANLSLKKRNAVRWESSKRRPIAGVDVFKSFVEKVKQDKFDNVKFFPLPQDGKNKLFSPITDKILSKVVVINTPTDILDAIVFGSDDPKTVVVKETFEGYTDFQYKDGTLTINCYRLYTNIDEIQGTDDEPVFAFSNHIGQAHGIEFRSFSRGLLYNGDTLKGSAAEIDFADLK